MTRNAPGRRRAPRLFLGRTPDGNRWRFREDVPEQAAARLGALCEEEPVTSDPREPPRNDARYRDILAAQAPVGATFAGPAYRFPAELPRAAANLVRLDAENAALLRGGDLESWLANIGRSEPVMAVVHEGRAVSVCGSVRITADVHEAGVETSASARGRGFAPLVVAGWARAVRELGAEPLYSTSWRNTASQAVARTLGLILYGTDYSLD